jgi:hypothetical protein
MVKITWSHQLMHAVKELKRLEVNKIANPFKESTYFNSFQLSYTEGQALASLKPQNQSSVSTQSWWD